MSQDFGEQPCPIDALGVSLARRPRLYWITWQLQSGEGAQVHTPEQPGWECYGTVDLQGKVNPSVYLTPGWTGASDQPLPTFTTARPRAAPGRRPSWARQAYGGRKATMGTGFLPVSPLSIPDLLSTSAGKCSALGQQYTLHCLPKNLQGSVQHQDTRLEPTGQTAGMRLW